MNEKNQTAKLALDQKCQDILNKLCTNNFKDKNELINYIVDSLFDVISLNGCDGDINEIKNKILHSLHSTHNDSTAECIAITQSVSHNAEELEKLNNLLSKRKTNQNQK